MINQVHISFWGVRGSTPCPNAEYMVYGGNTSCIQIHLPDTEELLIVDCGTGFRNLGNHLDNKKNSHQGKIFVTHPHWDHLQGFPFFKPFYNSANRFRVYLPPQDGSECRDILEGHLSHTFFPVSLSMMQADLECHNFEQGVCEFDHFTVDYLWARHTIQTAIFRFNIGGKILIVAPDNELPVGDAQDEVAFIEDFRQFVRGADLLIHDGQYSLQQYKERVGWGHSAMERVLEVCEDLEIKRLYLTHHDPDSDDVFLSTIDKKIKTSQSEIYSDVRLAKDGMSVTL